MNGETIPLEHLSGFDSLCGLETIVTLEERLGVTLEHVPFVAASTFRPLKVDEIVEIIIVDGGFALAERMTSSAPSATDGGGT
jgi:hypothetical protein